jgi:lipopolysaccharide transport system permease protein
MGQKAQEDWTLEIKSKGGITDLNLKDLWKYQDLILLFVRRDFIAVYKQTILGPLWFVIQPVITALIYTLVFSKIAGISTDNLPTFLFYNAGIVVWTYFADCLTKTSTTFTSNAHIFGKVYFPRLTVPVSIVISNLLKFCIQLMIFLVFMLIFYLNGDRNFNPNINVILLTPVLLLVMAGMGLGFGIIISSLTIKYKDLTFLIGFAVQLAMYSAGVIIPLSSIPQKYRLFVEMNPMTHIVEVFRYGFLGSGSISPGGLIYSVVFTVIVLVVGVMLFNKVEKTFMDTV